MEQIPSAVAVLFPGADTVLRILPVPMDYALLIKLSTAMLCVFLYLAGIKPPSVRWGRLLFIGGLVTLTVYLFATQVLLYSSPFAHRAGDNSTVGLWLTETAAKKKNNQGLSDAQLRAQYTPSEWELIYSKPSQLATVGILLALYSGTFSMLTVGGRRLQ
jgi:hypothetical protein